MGLWLNPEPLSGGKCQVWKGIWKTFPGKYTKQVLNYAHFMNIEYFGTVFLPTGLLSYVVDFLKTLLYDTYTTL
jgi:hypothetical protein